MINRFFSIIKFSKALKMLLLSLILSFGLLSCNYLIEETQLQNNKGKEEKGLVKINIRLQDNSTSRTALSEIYSNNIEEIKLTGVLEGKNYTLGSWWDISQIQEDDLYLQTGDWQLKLSAKYRITLYNNTNELIYSSLIPFSDTKNITISLNEVENINFKLASETEKGSLLFTLTFSDNSNVDHGKYKITKYPSGEEVSGAAGSLTIATGSYSKWVEIAKYGDNALKNGNYFITVDLFGDVAEQNLLNTYSSIINIKKGFPTRLNTSIIINQLYDITWHTDGGVLAAGASLIEHYSMRTTNIVTFPVLSKEGYDWQGWYTEADGGGNLVTSLPANSTGDKEFFAHFTPIEYSITYELNGGTNHSSNPASYTVEDADISLQNPTKTGFEFDGWYTDSAFTNRIESISTAEKENLTLYAKWSVLTNVQLLPVFPGNYSCKWSSAVNASNETVITITIRDSESNPVTPDSINIKLCINGEATGSQFSSASFVYPAALQTIAAPGDYSFYVTVEINGQSYSFYAVSE